MNFTLAPLLSSACRNNSGLMIFICSFRLNHWQLDSQKLQFHIT